MRDIFYLTEKSLKLTEIKTILVESCGYDCYLNANKDGLEIRVEKEIIQIVKLDIAENFGDPEDIRIIESTETICCLCISHHTSALKYVLIFMKFILSKYGGWIGNDSDGFEPRFTLNNLSNFCYSVR